MLPPQLGTRLPLSSMYMAIVIMICFKLLVQVMLLEALGWQKYSCMAGRIAVVAKAMSEKESLAEEVRREALKTYNRLKRLK